MEHNSNEQSERAPTLFNSSEKGQMDPPSSKIPRLVNSGKMKFGKMDKGVSRLGRNLVSRSSGTGSRHKGDRPDSASQNIEAKFKSQILKFQKELKGFIVLKDNLNKSRASMMKLKEEMLEKQMKDPGPIPNMPPWILNELEADAKTDILSLKEENNSLKKRLDDISAKCLKSTGYLSRIQAEMPKIEEDYQTMMEVMNNAEQKQTCIETHLEHVQSEICNIVNNLKTFTHCKDKSEMLAKQLESVQNELKCEKEKFRAEMMEKEEELAQFKNEYENESKKRQSLETKFMNLNKEKVYLQESCNKFMKQMESLKQIRQLLPDDAGAVTLNHDAISDQLAAEVEALNISLKESQITIENLSKDKEILIQQVNELNKQKEALHNDLEQTCHQCLFIKENQIYSIKSKMDEIVKLKNVIDSDENDNDLFDMDVIMYLSDTESLKNEVVKFHKRWVDAQEEKKKAIDEASAKENKIDQLEHEVSVQNKTIEGLESLVKTLKQKDKENVQNINSLQAAVFRRDQTMVNDGSENDVGAASNFDSNFNPLQPIDEKLLDSGDETMFSTRELLTTVEKYKGTIAGMERKLNDLEATHSLCAERRTRNEQRIALLEIHLAKYE